MEGFFACSSPLPYYIFVIAIRISPCGFRSRIGRSFTTQHLLRKLNVSLRRGCAMARPGAQALTLFTRSLFTLALFTFVVYSRVVLLSRPNRAVKRLLQVDRASGS